MTGPRATALTALLALLAACLAGPDGTSGQEAESARTGLTDHAGAPPIALLGATILDGTGRAAIEDGALIVSSDTVACVGRRADCPVPEGAKAHDVTGRFLTPGLIDAHVHFSQTGWLDGRPDGLDVRARYPYQDVVRELRTDPGRFFASYPCAGVTAVFDVGGFRWTVAMARAAEDDPEAPHIRAVGPLISHAGREVLSADDDSQFIMLTSAEAGRRGVRELAELGADAVKVWYLEPPAERWDEIEGRFRAVAEEAEVVGLPLLVHATELRTATVAVEAGAFMLVHSVTDEAVDDAFLALTRARGTLYAPTLVVGDNWGRAVEAAVTGTIPEWNDPLGCVDEWTERKLREAPELRALVDDDRFTPEAFEGARAAAARGREVMADNLRRVHAAGIPVVLATDAGNPLTLHGASIHQELDAMEAAGIPPAELVVMATRNGARALGRPDLGTLEAGQVADVLVLSRDPRETADAFRALEAVIHQGTWHRPLE